MTYQPIPPLKPGQIWQCRNQNYAMKVTGRLSTSSFGNLTAEALWSGRRDPFWYYVELDTSKPAHCYRTVGVQSGDLYWSDLCVLLYQATS